MLTSIAGVERSLSFGDVVDVEPRIGAVWIAEGMAVAVRDEAVETQAQNLSDVETADAPKPRGRWKKR